MNRNNKEKAGKVSKPHSRKALPSVIFNTIVLTWAIPKVKNRALRNSVKEFIEIKFFICLHNQLSSTHFFVT